jgi:signal transduction histidine kinase
MTGPGNAPEMTQDAALAQFAARVAHDFNNLLTGILGNLELLQLRAARHNLRGLDPYLDGANSAGTRAVAFAARLMVFSGRATSPPVDVPVDELLGKFAPRAQCRLAAAGASLLCDPDQLELAVTELVDNAAAAGGEIFISSSATAEDIAIIVRDTGCGMEPETLRQAQEPFFTTNGNATGKGLGLAIVARVVRNLGGTMSIDTAPGQGCTVTLSFPRS